VIRRRAHGLLALTVAALVALGAAGCSGSGPSAAPVRRTVGRSQLYVALGGDDVYGVGPQRLVDAWPQVLFATSLPVSAAFVNLANPGQGAAEIDRGQVPVAVRLRPDLATITLLTDIEQGTAPIEVQRRLIGILDRVHQVNGLRVLVGTAPPGSGSPTAVRAFNAAVTEATRAGGGELVDLGAARATDPQRQGRQIADAFAQAVRRAPPAR
jgi:hypothetical protein